MLIFRIEAKNNPRTGCFQGDDSPADRARQVALRTGVFDPYEHPGPPSEGINIHYREVCGLPHLDAYRTWFVTPAVRAALYESGTHHMRVYDVPDDRVKKGMLQVCFNPDHATSVRLATPEEMS